MTDLNAGNFDLVIDDINITGNPVSKQVLITFNAKGIGLVAILMESASMEVIQDEGIIDFWKTEIQKEILHD